MKNKIFAYIILGLNILAAWVSWWILAGAILGNIKHSWLCPLLAFSFWGIVFTLGVIFIRNKKLLYLVFLTGAFPYPMFFGLNFSILGVLVVILLFVFTERQTKKEIGRGIKVDFHHLVSHTLKYFVTAVCLVAAVAYYFSIAEDSKSGSAVIIEKKTLEAELDWGLKAASFVLPDDKKEMVDDIVNNMTVDDFLSKNFVQPEIANSGNSAEGATEAAKLIGGAATLEIQKAMLDKSKRDLARQLGVDVVGEQPMKEVLMAYIDKTERSFFDYSGTDKFYIPIVLAFGMFLTARILGTAVDIFLGLLILGIIKILQIFEVIKLNKEQREVAVIEYSV